MEKLYYTGHIKSRYDKIREILEETFPQVKEFSIDYLDDKVILATDDYSYISVMDRRINANGSMVVHLCFAVLSESLRGKGLGKKYLDERIDFIKTVYPNHKITCKVNKKNYVNLGLMIRKGFNIYGETDKSYKLIYNNETLGK